MTIIVLAVTVIVLGVLSLVESWVIRRNYIPGSTTEEHINDNSMRLVLENTREKCAELDAQYPRGGATFTDVTEKLGFDDGETVNGSYWEVLENGTLFIETENHVIINGVFFRIEENGAISNLFTGAIWDGFAESEDSGYYLQKKRTYEEFAAIRALKSDAEMVGGVYNFHHVKFGANYCKCALIIVLAVTIVVGSYAADLFVFKKFVNTSD